MLSLDYVLGEAYSFDSCYNGGWGYDFSMK